jgi:hypothetical protein
MGFEAYLIESVNQINGLLAKSDASPEKTSNYLLEAAAIGCRVLKQLVGDTTLNTAVEEFADVRIIKGFLERTSDEYKRRQAKADEFRAIIEENEQFEAFLDLEREILIRGGLSRDIVNPLIASSRESVKEVRDRAKPPSEVIEAVRLLRDRACLLADDLIRDAKEEGSWEHLKEKIKKIMLGLGGAALIGLNASSLATSVGITAAGSAVSAAIGATVIQSAAADIAKARGAIK